MRPLWHLPAQAGRTDRALRLATAARGARPINVHADDIVECIIAREQCVELLLLAVLDQRASNVRAAILQHRGEMTVVIAARRFPLANRRHGYEAVLAKPVADVLPHEGLDIIVAARPPRPADALAGMRVRRRVAARVMPGAALARIKAGHVGQICVPQLRAHNTRSK